ncbi:hypothetical protein QFC22_003523 [Naganishia vaughanmartiniae]|uniref:Uncharacterized protein n=1 Tax=Naganishia vaughanmartiniae TaxID=1424756 RepID=A0ACC2X4U2_9TREE|nr:hypothetical protein QFC22_003523 [Naganishia vaughanmartiniae]
MSLQENQDSSPPQVFKDIQWLFHAIQFDKEHKPSDWTSYKSFAQTLLNVLRSKASDHQDFGKIEAYLMMVIRPGRVPTTAISDSTVKEILILFPHSHRPVRPTLTGSQVSALTFVAGLAGDVSRQSPQGLTLRDIERILAGLDAASELLHSLAKKAEETKPRSTKGDSGASKKSHLTQVTPNDDMSVRLQSIRPRIADEHGSVSPNNVSAFEPMVPSAPKKETGPKRKRSTDLSPGYIASVRVLAALYLYR